MTTFIETELKAALEGLPTRASSFGRFDKGLAYTVLMKFYMHEKNWAKAVECGRELMKADYGYGLMDTYQSIFTLENEQNKEIILPVRKKEEPSWNYGTITACRATILAKTTLSNAGTVSKFPGRSIAHSIKRRSPLRTGW